VRVQRVYVGDAWLTPAQRALFLRAARNGGHDAGSLPIVKQLEAKGLVSRAGLGVYQRHEWGRLKATLHKFILTPAGKRLAEMETWRIFDAACVS